MTFREFLGNLVLVMMIALVWSIVLFFFSKDGEAFVSNLILNMNNYLCTLISGLFIGSSSRQASNAVSENPSLKTGLIPAVTGPMPRRLSQSWRVITVKMMILAAATYLLSQLLVSAFMNMVDVLEAKHQAQFSDDGYRNIQLEAYSLFFLTLVLHMIRYSYDLGKQARVRFLPTFGGILLSSVLLVVVNWATGDLSPLQAAQILHLDLGFVSGTAGVLAIISLSVGSLLLTAAALSLLLWLAATIGRCSGPKSAAAR